MLDQINTQQWMEKQLEKIPPKLSFRIGEVSKILSVKPYILRYWESEFDQLKPSKLDNKQRLYFHKDVELLFLIKKLLYQEGYSIRGAKQALKTFNKEFKQVKKDHQNHDRLTNEVHTLLKHISRLKSLINGS